MRSCVKKLLKQEIVMNIKIASHFQRLEEKK